jgi:uncharacterized repeat protein (TIGR03803 family)
VKSSAPGRSSLSRLGLATLLLIPAAARAQTYDILYSFSEVGPIDPEAALIQTSDGGFLGTSAGGGTAELGTVYKIDSSGNVTTLHSFINTDGGRPSAGLIQATDGSFYGTTSTFGIYGYYGTVFKMDSSGNLTTLHSFAGDDGGNPHAGLIQASDGSFYGTTSTGGTYGDGTVFRMDSSGNLTTIHSFTGSDGANPYARLIQATDGDFYGTTVYGGAGDQGTVFKMDSAGNTTRLYSFTYSAGILPYAELIQGSDGYFYGTTLEGGAHGTGTVFKIDTAGNLTTLHSFDGTDGDNPYAGLIQASDGNLYGTTRIGGTHSFGTVFRMDSSGNVTVLHNFPDSSSDGNTPYAGLIQATDGSFYGTTASGGGGNQGTVFKMDTSGNLTILQNLTSGGLNGALPQCVLFQAPDGDFYGTTLGGGTGSCSFGCGTVFTMDSNLTTLHSFSSSPNDGGGPFAGLIQATDGTFYGTTAYGGTVGYGTVFKMDSAGNLTTLQSFTDTGGSGDNPFAALIQATDGNFYGTTYGGGTDGGGTVFKIDSSGNLTTLHNFAGSPNDSAGPFAGLIQATDGSFYGTGGGGINGYGAVFKMDSSGIVTILHSFSGSDGANPYAGLIQAADGDFYGTTRNGGASGGNGYGTVFKIDSAGNLTTLHSFVGSDGGNPYAGLIQGSDGNFYGTTYGGTTGGCYSGCGNVFSMDSSGIVTILHSFSGGDGGNPIAGLIQATDGNFYGTTSGWGVGVGGVIFRLSLCLPPVASSNSPICSGQTLHLSAYPTTGATYSWAGPNGFSSTLQAPTVPNATAADSGVYTVTVTAGTCAAAQASVNVAVNSGAPPAPVIASSLCVPANTSGLTASVAANPGDLYNWSIFGGTIDSGQGTSGISFSSGEPGTQVRLSVVESNTSCSSSDTKIIQVDYGDVPAANPFHDFICTIARNGITAGCGSGNYCPNNNVLRSQMAIFLLRGEHGSTYLPPACTGIFSDVTCPGAFTNWIEQLYAEGITGGCSTNPLFYCPANPVSRAVMAVFLLVAQHGTGYTPPACAGLFSDVACPGPFADWIEQLYGEGITGGCSTNPLNYCPGNPVTRAQMAVFLTATFNLL